MKVRLHKAEPVYRDVVLENLFGRSLHNLSLLHKLVAELYLEPVNIIAEAESILVVNINDNLLLILVLNPLFGGYRAQKSRSRIHMRTPINVPFAIFRSLRF